MRWIEQAMSVLAVEFDTENLYSALDVIASFPQPNFLQVDVGCLKERVVASYGEDALKVLAKLPKRVRQWNWLERSDALERCELRVEIVCRAVKVILNEWKGGRARNLPHELQLERNKKSNSASQTVSRLRGALFRRAIMEELAIMNSRVNMTASFGEPAGGEETVTMDGSVDTVAGSTELAGTTSDQLETGDQNFTSNEELAKFLSMDESDVVQIQESCWLQNAADFFEPSHTQ
eukprot:CAMPEP_0198733952 /NCGR_PEP_ID=MMETSP1475-20131203/49402_1 /TAXON_ID= ORGANISM="Unidentified sp., Strain CCMP1999" /NCGR_SAMPLE_ID=MMETSP1475 /ASSEMBLY_ACC=CAM_ASM_001111 /LENGTH=234 /DNA_ID=CAMNT_0044497337 /DNA_START=62 /DNA_END=766 /DNA_ORIENTATION=-